MNRPASPGRSTPRRKLAGAAIRTASLAELERALSANPSTSDLKAMLATVDAIILGARSQTMTMGELRRAQAAGVTVAELKRACDAGLRLGELKSIIGAGAVAMARLKSTLRARPLLPDLRKIMAPAEEDLARYSTAQLLEAHSAATDVLNMILRDDPGILEIEQRFIEFLSAHLDGRMPDALEAVRRIIASGQLDAILANGDLTAILAAFRAPLFDGLDAAAAEAATSAIEDAYALGREKPLEYLGENLSLDWNLTDEHAQKVLAGDTLYWVGNAWDNQLGGDIAGVIQREVIEKGLGRQEAGSALERIFGEEFPGRARSYWNIVASAGVVRSRTFGTVGTFEQAEVETFIFRNPVDSRSSLVCTHLNGREFHVSAAVAQRDSFLAAESPDEAKEAHAWPDPKEVVRMSTEQLQAAGIIQPPLHGHCRSILIPGKMAGDGKGSGTKPGAPEAGASDGSGGSSGS